VFTPIIIDTIDSALDVVPADAAAVVIGHE
jgi:hypothetical protein